MRFTKGALFVSAVRTMCWLCTVSQFRSREVTKRARHLARIEKESEIGGRDSARDAGRILLHVVGNQPVMFFGAELGEIAPDAQRRKVQ